MVRAFSQGARTGKSAAHNDRKGQGKQTQNGSKRENKHLTAKQQAKAQAKASEQQQCPVTCWQLMYFLTVTAVQMAVTKTLEGARQLYGDQAVVSGLG